VRRLGPKDEMLRVSSISTPSQPLAEVGQLLDPPMSRLEGILIMHARLVPKKYASVRRKIFVNEVPQLCVHNRSHLVPHEDAQAQPFHLT